MDSIRKFRKLFEPGKIGCLELKNRIIMPPMATSFPTLWGEANDTLREYLKARAKGGAALIFTESVLVATAIDQLRQLCRMLRLDDDGFAPALAEVVETIHQAGAKAGIQLSPGMSSQARNAPWSALWGQDVQGIRGVGPSGVIHPEVLKPAREMSIEEIEKLIKLFGAAAARAKGVGFDIIEIHGHSGFLVGQFLSPYFNKRTDKYGGTPEKRFRFLAELIDTARQQVGGDFPLAVKFSIDEFLEGGRTLKDGQWIARELEKAGIDAITVSSGIHGVKLPSMPSMYHADGAFIPLAEAVKEVVSIPVILPGKLGDPDMALKALEEGKADFIGWGRPLIADPDMPRKVAEGRIDQIRRCIFCNECIRVQWAYKAPLRCTVNPLAGRENQYSAIRPAEIRKKVFVIGAGPAGMETARIAALRGHDVTLYEKSKELGGGQLKIAAIPPHKEVLKRIVNYYTVSYKSLSNLKVVLGKKVTASEAIKSGADVVVVATGADAFIPEMPGVDGSNVITAHRFLEGKKIIGDMVIVVGGGSVGCEVASVIAGQGKKVTVVEMLDAVSTDVHAMVRIGLLSELKERGVNIVTGVKVSAITDDGIKATDKTSKEVNLKADTVVLALGAESRDELSKKLFGKVKELYIIGDAKKPGMIRDAVSEGFAVAYDI